MATTKIAPVSIHADSSSTQVLLVDDNPTSRLTLQTILRASGYGVDTAASAAEAIGKLESQTYDVVLSDLSMESPDAGYRVVDHARMMDYRPATAIISAQSESQLPECAPASATRTEQMLVEPENVPEFLEFMADLVGDRAVRQIGRMVRSRN